MKKRIASFILALVLVLGCLPFSAGAAGDAISLDAAKELLNAEPLHPQKTGYKEIDQILEKIDAPNNGKDTYTRIREMYDWAVTKIEYSWEGYSQTWAPAYDKFTLKYDLTYESALPEVYPKDVIYRTYHMLTARKGVCYDWGILFTVMARYIGIESYIHTGTLHRGTWSGHHGWTELKLGGKNYIFDTQSDFRRWQAAGHVTYEHFGILAATAKRFIPQYDVNAARDKLLRPPYVTLSVVSVHPEAITGAGIFDPGTQVTLSAKEDIPFSGWYASNGKLLSEENNCTVTPTSDMTVFALFEGDLFADTPTDKYYYSAVQWAVQEKITAGTGTATFSPNDSCTRAQAVTFLWRAAGSPKASVPAGFADVGENAYYADAVAWAVEKQITNGISETKFAPDQKCTRAQIVTFQHRAAGEPTASSEGSFSDVPATAYYCDAVNWAAENSITNGTSADKFSPDNICTRGQIVTMLYRHDGISM